MGRRFNIEVFSDATQLKLANLMWRYINDQVVDHHRHINHFTSDFLIGHRAYLADMEKFVSLNTGGEFALLPKWNPSHSVPPEFTPVKPQDDGALRPALRNLNPGVTVPDELLPSNICRFANIEDLAINMSGWHGGLHLRINGSMADLSIASAALIFWLWHAFVDDIYWDWERCRT